MPAGTLSKTVLCDACKDKLIEFKPECMIKWCTDRRREREEAAASAQIQQ
jgi:hypothetical protein